MPDIVYEMGDGGDGKGTLFKGKRFCFLMRVPCRDKWINDVKANGGEIVKLEKQADFIIADHAIKGYPVESISWKLIEDSVKEGRLQDVAAYRKIPSQPAGQPPRSTRTPFTAEDDRFLAEWVAKAERSGEVTKGNILYQKLEQVVRRRALPSYATMKSDTERKNNRHTAQSWRDRWVKYVSKQPRPPPTTPSHRTSTSGPLPASRGSPPNQRSALQSSVSDEIEPLSRTSPALDKRALGQTHRLSAAPTGSPRPTSAGASNARLSTRKERSHPKTSTGEAKFTNEEMDLLRDAASDIMNLDEDRAIDAWITWADTYPSHTAQEWRNCFIEVIAPGLREKAKKKHKIAPSPTGAKKVSTIAPQEGYLQNESSSEGTDSNLPIAKSESATERSRPSMMAEKVFKKKLAILASAQSKEVVLTATICGRAVSLYKIWQVVQSKELGGFTGVDEKRLWPVVARKLNFNDFQHKNAANELELWYRDILLILDDAHDEFERLSEDKMIQIQLNSATSERDDSTEDSRPVKTSRESHDAQSSRKRQRIDKGKVATHEIPGTPERIVDSTPVHQSFHSTQQRRDSSRMAMEDVEEESESELSVRPFKKISLSAASTPSVADRLVAEPETQDFHYPLEQHDELETVPCVPASHRRRTNTKSQNSTTHEKITEGSSTRRRAEAQTEAQDLGSFIDHYTSLGYDTRYIIEALEATTMDTGDAAFVMESLQQGKGVPRDIQGVWTPSDDEAVEGADHPNFGDAVEKHGIDRVGRRRQFLADQKAARDQLSRSK